MTGAGLDIDNEDSADTVDRDTRREKSTVRRPDVHLALAHRFGNDIRGHATVTGAILVDDVERGAVDGARPEADEASVDRARDPEQVVNVRHQGRGDTRLGIDIKQFGSRDDDHVAVGRCSARKLGERDGAHDKNDQ